MYNEEDCQYLQMMQEIITRMASNSANCKNWMITLVAGMLAVSCSINELNGWILISLFPIFTFWYLDTFYLELERKMRNRQLDFVLKTRQSDTSGKKKALFCFAPLEKDKITSEERAQGFVVTNDRAFSKSIAPFYGSIIFVVVIISVVLNYEAIASLICK